MVALDKQFVHHHGTKPRSCGRLRDESWQTGKSPGHRTADILSARSHRDTSYSSNTSCANEIIYCGYRFDPESQLYYVRNRKYNPALGRWIQRDPIGYAGGINLYGYVGGMPAGGVDPWGALTVEGTLAKFAVYEGFGFKISVRYKRKIEGKREYLRLTADMHVGTGIGLEFELFGEKIEADATVGPQLGRSLILDLHNGKCGGPLNSGYVESKLRLSAGLSFGVGLLGFSIEATGRAGGAFDIFFKADPSSITFELAGEFDFWMVGEASFLWWTKRFEIPVPPGPGINAPAKIYEHSWPNPF